MIGQRVESRPSPPWVALLLLAIGFALLAGGLATGRVPMAIGSALPIAIALSMMVLGWERAFVARFEAQAIEVEDPPASIPYEDLRDLRAGGIPHDPSLLRKRAIPIHLEHQGGILRIPRRLNVPSDEVYRFLAGRIPPNGDRAVNSALAEYLGRQEAYFGADQVWTYRASRRRPGRGRYRKLRAFSAGLVLGGAAWMVAGFGGLAESGWGFAGAMTAGLGACFLLATLADPGTGLHIKNWKNASLVIGPQGMAMVQGDIQGEVRWPELLEVRFKPKPSTFRLTQAQGLHGIILKVKGADILIADIYDRPLFLIHDRIRLASGRSAPDDLGIDFA